MSILRCTACGRPVDTDFYEVEELPDGGVLCPTCQGQADNLLIDKLEREENGN